MLTESVHARATSPAARQAPELAACGRRGRAAEPEPTLQRDLRLSVRTVDRRGR